MLCQWLPLGSQRGRLCVRNLEICACNATHVPRSLATKIEQRTFFTLFEELKNIENRAAWFSCRTVQGRKRSAKGQAKPAPDRARKGVFSASPCLFAASFPCRLG
jgi:hypothetical protein